MWFCRIVPIATWLPSVVFVRATSASKQTYAHASHTHKMWITYSWICVNCTYLLTRTYACWSCYYIYTIEIHMHDVCTMTHTAHTHTNTHTYTRNLTMSYIGGADVIVRVYIYLASCHIKCSSWVVVVAIRSHYVKSRYIWEMRHDKEWLSAPLQEYYLLYVWLIDMHANLEIFSRGFRNRVPFR